MQTSRLKLILLVTLLIPFNGISQQVPDKGFSYEIKDPSFLPGKGPVIAIDEAHNNFHTREGRYYSFAKLLEQDGFNLISNKSEFTSRTLEEFEILVISNALNDEDTSEWKLPNPSAFTKNEIRSLVNWVKAGGKLFLIADHMPFPGAASDLASQLGVTMFNGFASDKESRRPPTLFTKENKMLIDNQFTSDISQVATFTGQGFDIPENAFPILQFDSRFVSLEPETAWEFDEYTETRSLEGLYQGAAFGYGYGKVVVFGEAAMFTTQLAGAQKFKMGMNNPDASENPKLLLNLIRWLEK